jgi:cephalosporin hydroxylase
MRLAAIQQRLVRSRAANTRAGRTARTRLRVVRQSLAQSRLAEMYAARTVKRFHRLYYSHDGRTWLNTRWFGTRVLKCPFDLWVYQELLERIRPELVIETGTADGGSAFFIASCMDLLGRGRVITIDVDDLAGRPQHDRITYLHGSSVDPAVVEQVRTAAARAAAVMVILDSDHSRDHVLAELNAYSPVVTEGSYLIVEDTNVNGRPVFPRFGPGPHEAVEAFLRGGAAFTRDEECEKFFLTFNPGGYLKRVERGS